MELEKFKSITIPLRDKLYHIAKKMLTDKADAEDAVQETYLRLWSKKEQIENHPKIEAYVVQMLKNICIDKIRGERYDVSLDSISVEEGSKNPHVYTEQNDNMRIMRLIIDSLPELQRRIILMRDVEGYELSEIAEIMGSEETAVRVNLSRARKRVREKFVSMNVARLQKA